MAFESAGTSAVSGPRRPRRSRNPWRLASATALLVLATALFLALPRPAHAQRVESNIDDANVNSAYYQRSQQHKHQQQASQQQRQQLLQQLSHRQQQQPVAWQRHQQPPPPRGAPSALNTRHRSVSDDSDLVWPKYKRQFDDEATQQTIATLGETDPFSAATQADAQTYVKGNTSGNDYNAATWTPDSGNYQQLPWNTNVYFQQSSATNGSETGGWQELPETPGFILNRTLSIPNGNNSGSGIMPFYITENTNTPETVKRAILMWPGKPRDTWNYANLMLNARSVVATNFASWGITNDSVLILAPAFLDAADMTAGAAHQGEITFGGELWQRGSASKTPDMPESITSYEIMDFFADMLFNKTYYPNLNQVVVVGHSLGGQASMRYALLKKTKYYDNNMRFWVGNPGSWTWLSDARPYPGANNSCLPTTDESYTSWPYGLNGNQSEITKYARKDVLADQDWVVQRYINRTVHYALALLDNGEGDSRCQAMWQGANHLDRGSQFILQYQSLNLSKNAFPAAHTVDFIVNTAHQDYPMYSANESLQRIFNDGFNTRNPDLTNVTNPGDKTNTTSDGVKAFATPLHEKVAIGLLVGTIAAVTLTFTALMFLSTPNYDAAWEESVKAAAAVAGGGKMR